MKGTIKNTTIVTLFLLSVVAITSFHPLAGVAYVCLWSYTVLVIDLVKVKIKKANEETEDEPI